MDSTHATPDFWRKCTTCKKPIAFGQKYWICSVSTCNRIRTQLIFCNVSCFDAHVPVMNHRDAGAFEKRAPSLEQWKREQQAAPAPASSSSSPSASQPPRPSPAPVSAQPQPGPEPAGESDEILVVVSKIKDYIRARSGMNTSDAVMRVLSHHLRTWLKDSIRRAAQDDRKTVLDRDVR